MERSFEGCLLSPEDKELLDRFSVYADGDVKEATNLCAAVDFFAEAMKEKLIRKLAEQGFWGWDNVSGLWGVELGRKIVQHAEDLEGTPGIDPDAEVDIANLAMFHHYLREALRGEPEKPPVDEREECRDCKLLSACVTAGEHCEEPEPGVCVVCQRAKPMSGSDVCYPCQSDQRHDPPEEAEPDAEDR